MVGNRERWNHIEIKEMCGAFVRGWRVVLSLYKNLEKAQAIQKENFSDKLHKQPPPTLSLDIEKKIAICVNQSMKNNNCTEHMTHIHTHILFSLKKTFIEEMLLREKKNNKEEKFQEGIVMIISICCNNFFYYLKTRQKIAIKNAK